MRRANGRGLLAMLLLTLALPAGWTVAGGEEPEPLGIGLEGLAYPHPVCYLQLAWRGKDLRMAYMEVEPEHPNGRTVVLMHGKNFFGAYWASTIEALSGAGYRVVVPDQIGFGRSSKPDLPYSFHLLASWTADLLDALEIEEAALVGHSMGGMLAARFALMHPERTTHLVLENPIGLEDYRQLVPYASTEQLYRSVLDQTRESILQFHRRYYVVWKEAYEAYAMVHYRWMLSGEFPRLAWVSALTSQMIYQQPVVHELADLRVPTLLVIGQEDRTAPGGARADPETRARMGQYPELGRAAQRAIPRSELVELEEVGHTPHLEAPDDFHDALVRFLER